MQLIAECYDLMKRGWGMSNEQMADLFGQWSKSEIGGFLLDITSTVLRKKDEATGKDLVDEIKDEAKQKGTGKWTSQDAMDLRVPVPTIDAAVSARDLSDLKAQRAEASRILGGPQRQQTAKPDVEGVKNALYVAMVATYAQGLAQLQAASAAYGYGVDIATVAAIWRAGCIIRSALLKDITEAYRDNPSLANLMVDPAISAELLRRCDSLRETIRNAMDLRIPMPAFMASLNYMEGYASERLPANLIQAQRDYFGAHTYARLDREGVFHTDWAAEGEVVKNG
jgi:6-phosphogluconate dehydrogenase